MLLLDEPTRGVDVGAKQEIYELMNQWTTEGNAILLITSEMPELLAISDRILVMHRGRIVGPARPRGGHAGEGPQGGHGGRGRMNETPSAERELLVDDRGPRHASEAPVAEHKSVLRTAFERPWVRALAPLVFVLILGAVFNADGTFFKWDTHRDMLRQVSVFGILACGMTLVIITGGIDLSVGSILGFCAVLFSLLTIHLGWSAVGRDPARPPGGHDLRAALRRAGRPLPHPAVHRHAGHDGLRPRPGQVDLGRPEDLDRGPAARRQLPVRGPAARSSRAIDPKILGENVAVVTLIFLACVARLLGAPLQAPLGPVPVRDRRQRGGGAALRRPDPGVKLLAYGLSGLFCAVAGICQAAQEQQGDPEAGCTYELTAIAIVVIGGTSLIGGRGGIG